jgi:acyl-coenzyme A synthetase/AMP-(fatty) acid ligase
MRVEIENSYPLSPIQHGMLFHTLYGRYRPDGLLEIVGRLDDQVKIRGVRVEPDEVTAILSQHPALKECVVVA